MGDLKLAGLIELPWWAYVLVALGFTHITIAAVTLYLHRHQTHRALDLHPLVAHFFRFWLWLTTGMVTKQWVAVHRKHHARVETAEDPHSPLVLGIRRVLWRGAELYRAAADDRQLVARYGHNTPEDWLERRIYAAHPGAGITLMLLIDVALFGAPGLTIWAVQMMWIPFFAAGVINGIGHYWGYRNFELGDTSTNIIPWGFLIGGEELHNNHHAFASSAKFSSRRWEFDLGWGYIRLLQALRLARVKKIAPVPKQKTGKNGIDLDTVHAVVANHLHVMAHYARDVVTRVYREELRRAAAESRTLLKPLKKWLKRDSSRLDAQTRARMALGLAHSRALDEVYQFKLRLQALWTEKTMSHEALLAALQEWCRQAEATGIQALRDFALSLRRYSLFTA
ncbi:MAG TPA: fatty acid desaturase [Gammaproteobacteria bacterium]|nr:fatty acid desaturase [Gammaproteobacteria bacterium]